MLRTMDESASRHLFSTANNRRGNELKDKSSISKDIWAFYITVHNSACVFAIL